MRRNFETCLLALAMFLFYSVNMIIIVLGNPAVSDFVFNLCPNFSHEIHDLACSMIDQKRNGQELSPLPEGYEIDKERTSQRVFCIRHKYGAWAKYTWTSEHSQLDSSPGWLYKFSPYIVILGISLSLTVISLPFKFTRNSFKKFLGLMG